MKNLVNKVLAILFLLLMIVNNSLLIVISTAIDEIENLIDESKVSSVMELNLEKYVNYALPDESKGVMVQMNLKTGVKYEEGQEYKPLLTTDVQLALPKINDKYPESVDIIGLSTKATNGSDEARDFQYDYDKSNGQLKLIASNNEDEDGNRYSENVDNARDEYTVVVYYSDACFGDKNVDRVLEFNGVTKLTLDDERKTEITNDSKQEFTVKENISGIVSTRVETSDIYNGFISSNKLNDTDYKTEYTENLKVDFSYREIADEIKISSNNRFKNNDKEVDTDEIVYKSTKINKNDVLSKLGEDGFLKILSLDGEILGEINKETEALEDGTVEFVYQKEVTELVINLSKPLNLGTLNIYNTKFIKDTMRNIENRSIATDYNVEAINNVKKEDKDSREVVKEEKVQVYQFLDKNIVDVKNAETRIDLSIDKSDLTNNIQNDVMFKAYLFENDSRYSLFENPVIDIELPTEVDNVILGDISLLYGNGLEFSNAEVIDNGNNKIIRLSLIGSSSDYVLNSMVNGAELLIPATIIVKKDVLSTDSSIKYTYTNNVNGVNDYINQEKQYKDIGIYIDSIVQDVRNEYTNNLLSTIEEDNKEEFITEVIAKVGNTVLKENDIVYQGEAITYTFKFKNNSSQDIYNLNTICNIPEGTTFVTRNSLYSDVPIEGEEGNEINDIWDKKAEITEQNIFLEKLKSGDSFEQSYQVLVEETVEPKELISSFKTSIQGNVVKEESFKVVANSAELCANLYPQDPERGVYNNNDTHQLNIVNLSDKDIENVVVDVYVSKEITVNLDGLMGKFDEFSYDENKGILTLKYNRIEMGATENILINTIVDKFQNGVYRYDLILYAKVYTDNEIQYRSSLNSIEVVRPKISIIQTSEKESKKLLTDEEIEYNFVVKNESDVATYINIEDNLPDEIVPIEAEYEYFELDSENNQWNKKVEVEDISQEITIDGVVQSDFKLETYIPENEVLSIKIKAKADAIFESIDVVNVATVSGSDIFTITSNGIKNTVLYFGYQEGNEEPDDPDNPDDPNNPDNPDNPNNPDNPSIEENKYSINGVVWLDSDKDGRRTSNEKLLSNIEVKLFDMKTSKIVVDNDNNSMSTSTNNSGYYSFDNVKQGKYIVLFKFDTDKYSLTTYQKNAISESVNSDVILKEVNIDGNTYKAGVTDTIDLVKNYSNIDMGLVENDEFDLRLDKYISNITVNYNGQSKSYDYNNSKLAKVEIPSKQLANSLINVEYKIVVTNEGNTTGYVKEIIDYIPSDLKFNAIYNDGWRKDSSGNLVNDSLSGRKIEPGESVEVVLILTAKNITKSIVNAAEISKTYNVNELKDIDSTEANRDIKEDDYSTAEMIISIKTGILVSIFKFILMIAVVVGFAFAIYYFRNSNVRKIFLMSILLIGIVASGFASIARETKVIYWSELGHHLKNGIWGPVNQGGTYWCISESAHLCNKPHLYYLNDEYDCWSSGQVPHGLGSYLKKVFPDFNFGTSKDTKKSINMDKTKSPKPFKENDAGDDKEILVGPFEFSADVSDKYISSYDIYNENGKDITSKTLICDKNGKSKSISKSETFYLSVPSNTKKLKLTIKMEYKYKSEKSGLHFKTWYFDSKSGEDYCHGGANGFAQSLLEIKPITKKEEESVKDKLTWTVSSTSTPPPTPGENPDPPDPIETPDDGEYAIQITKVDDDKNNLEKVGFKFTAQIQVSELDNGKDIQNFSCIHYKPFWYDEFGTPVWNGIGYAGYDDYGNVVVREHTSDRVEFNKYTLKTYDYYLDSSGSWVKGSAENAHIYYTDSNGVISLSGKMPITKEENINMNGDAVPDSREVAGKFVGNITAIEVENPNYGYEAQGELTYGLSNGESKTIENTPDLGDINIHKIDADDNDYDLSGVEFKIAITAGSDKKYLQLKTDGHTYSGENVGSEAIIDKLNDDNASGGYYHVEYVSDVNQATIFTTSESGEISVQNLEMYYDKNTKYNYTFEEITNTNYGYKQEANNEYSVTPKEDGSDKNLRNTQEVTGLYIKKRDQRIFWQYGAEVLLNGVEFKIRISEGEAGQTKYLQLSNSSGVVKQITGEAIIDQHNEKTDNGNYTVKYVDGKEQGTTFITDKDGKIHIGNLEVWKNPKEQYTYYLDEISLGDEWSLYYDVKEESDSLKLEYSSYGDTVEYVDNYQKYVDLAGYIWEDIASQVGKEYARDNLYTEGSRDVRIQPDDLKNGTKKGITIQLMQNGKHLATAEAIKDGYKRDYFFPAQMKPSDSSKGIVWVNPDGYKIEIDKLSEYVIEFYYNGLKYQSVEAKDISGNPIPKNEYHQKENSSKADDHISDSQNSRNVINDNFYSIRGGDSNDSNRIKSRNGTKGETSTGVDLTYNSVRVDTGNPDDEVYESNLVQNTQYTKESLDGSVGDINAATIKASTGKDGSGYEIKFEPERQKVRKTIENINLGIYEREQTDLAVATDLEKIKMSINGYAHTYYYEQRQGNFDVFEGQNGYDAVMDGFSIQAKNRKGSKYKELSYVREIYPSYIAFSEDKEGDPNRLVVQTTYQIRIRNQSSLTSCVNTLRNYSDPKFELKYFEIIEGNERKELKNREVTHINEKIYDVNTEDLKIEGFSDLIIYVTYELKYDEMMKLIQPEGELETSKHVTEIISYSTFDKDKKDEKYASIDKDSAPDNTEYENFITYEDDIDTAPELKIKRSELEKMLTGQVFEDAIVTAGTTGNMSNGINKDEYRGNGKFDEDSENLVEDVTVELLNKDGNVALLYRIDTRNGRVEAPIEARQSTQNISHDETDMENRGYRNGRGRYEFVGLVPDIYYLKYTYGNDNGEYKTKIVNMNGEDVTGKETVNTQHYKSTIVSSSIVESNINDQTRKDENITEEDEFWRYPDYPSDDIVRDKGTNYGYWYQNKAEEDYSVAVDNYVKRREINEKLSDIYYTSKTDYDNNNMEKRLYIMEAQTPLICVAVEDRDNNTSKARAVDNTGNVYDANGDNNSNEKLPNSYETKFGIVERPRQNFEVKKEISYIKVTLANGQILLEGDPRENQKIGSYLTYPDGGLLKIEIDNEILEGAKLNVTYEISVANLSDLNYDQFKYYAFGKHDIDPVKTHIQLIDYMNRQLNHEKNDTNDPWTIEEVGTLGEQYLSPDTIERDVANNYNYIITGNKDVSKDKYYIILEPGGIAYRNILASKLLSTAKDMTYDNKVEFLTVYNSVGRFYKGTPGNNRFDTDMPNSSDRNDPDNNEDPNRATIVIVPPTGKAKVYYAVGIGCLILLLGGIVLIKKKVLD